MVDTRSTISLKNASGRLSSFALVPRQEIPIENSILKVTLAGLE
jgi:hypothetical protein